MLRVASFWKVLMTSVPRPPLPITPSVMRSAGGMAQEATAPLPASRNVRRLAGIRLYQYHRTVHAPLISRRSLLAGGTLLFAGPAAARPKIKVAIFSKHLQFLQGEDLAKGAAGMGFDAIDLTVRKGGHVEPANVARHLPPLVGIIRKNGLEV